MTSFYTSIMQAFASREATIAASAAVGVAVGSAFTACLYGNRSVVDSNPNDSDPNDPMRGLERQASNPDLAQIESSDSESPRVDTTRTGIKSFWMTYDGNGTFGTDKLQKSRLEGHKAGAKRLIEFIQHLGQRFKDHPDEVNTGTFWLLDPRNTQRDAKEVVNLMRVLDKGLVKLQQVAKDFNIKLHFIGDIHGEDNGLVATLKKNCPEAVEDGVKLVQTIRSIEEANKGKENAFNCVIGINYNGEAELANAANKAMKDPLCNGEISYKNLLQCSALGELGLPQPQIIIRTGCDEGEAFSWSRTSGCMRLAPKPLYCGVKEKGPDFTPSIFEAILKEYEAIFPKVNEKAGQTLEQVDLQAQAKAKQA